MKFIVISVIGQSADIEDKNIYNMLKDQKTMNSKFCEFVISNYKKWINNNREIFR